MKKAEWNKIRFEGIDNELLNNKDKISINIRRNWHKGTKSDTIIEGIFDYTNQRGIWITVNGEEKRINYKAIEEIHRIKD